MSTPSREEVYAKYQHLLDVKGYYKDASESERAAKKEKADAYFNKHYSTLERLEPIHVPEKPEELSSEQTEKAEEHKKKGNQYFSAGEYSTAVCEYTHAIECNPFNHIYYSNRAACYTCLDNVELAIRDARKCIELNPSFSKGYSRLSAALEKKGELEEALAAIEKAASLEPANETYKRTKEELEEEIRRQKGDSCPQPPRNAPAAEEQPKEEPKSNTTPSGSGAAPGGGLAGLFNNPAFMNMAQSMLNNPAMMNMAQSMMNNPVMRNLAQSMMGGQSGLDDLVNNPQVQRMAEQMMGANAQSNTNNEQNANESK